MADCIDFDHETWEEYAAHIAAKGYLIETRKNKELFISPSDPSDPNWNFPGSRLRIVLGKAERGYRYRWVQSYATIKKVERPLNLYDVASFLVQ